MPDLLRKTGASFAEPRQTAGGGRGVGPRHKVKFAADERQKAPLGAWSAAALQCGRACRTRVWRLARGLRRRLTNRRRSRRPRRTAHAPRPSNFDRARVGGDSERRPGVRAGERRPRVQRCSVDGRFRGAPRRPRPCRRPRLWRDRPRRSESACGRRCPHQSRRQQPAYGRQRHAGSDHSCDPRAGRDATGRGRVELDNHRQSRRCDVAWQSPSLGRAIGAAWLSPGRGPAAWPGCRFRHLFAIRGGSEPRRQRTG